MFPSRLSPRTGFLFVSAGAALALLGWHGRPLAAGAAPDAAATLAPEFAERVQPLLKANCETCHNADLMTSGVRVDHLDASLEERTLRLWEHVRARLADESMPPKGAPQPTADERRRAVDWIERALDIARSRPGPKNGMVRRLTVAQYRNTLRELLRIDDDLTAWLPPDAVSADGFVNNAETLQLSPLLMEAYFEVAEEALKRAVVEPKSRPTIQNFRLDFGRGINPDPLPGELILGANSLLLPNPDFVVTELQPKKPFPFEPFAMRRRYRFIEGYQGNDTVRDWREFDSIYHAVFACMRGSRGYPKGNPYDTVPEGLLLRPAIPTDELFGGDGTYGPKANFKIAVRELPNEGRFRVTVVAAKYDDGLLLDPGAEARSADAPEAIVVANPSEGAAARIPAAGLYQVDVYAGERREDKIRSDGSRLGEGLAGFWPFEEETPGVRLADSPFGRALTLTGDDDALAIPAGERTGVGEGDFTVAAWIHPRRPARAGVVARGGYAWTQGWYLGMPDNRGTLRLETVGPDTLSNGAISSPPGVVRPDRWQHIAAVVRRGGKRSRLYVNGYAVAEGEVGPANLDNPRLDLFLGRIPEAQSFRGEMDDVRLYRRALDEAELQALVEPGRIYAEPPPEPPLEVTLRLGEREFSGKLEQPAFLAVRLDAGELPLAAEPTGFRPVERVVLTPLDAGDRLAERFLAFEKRSPRLGVHLGFRRDCGHTFAPVGSPETVSSGRLQRFVFEGAMRNYPSPDVEDDNVNYLAGIREIGVRSEYTDGRDLPRLLIRSVEFEGPFHDDWPPPSHRAVFGDADRGDGSPERAREIVRSFAERAWRRPLAPGEDAAPMRAFERAFAATGDFRMAVRDAIQVVLTSPQFLFLIEASAGPQPEPLDDYELASKLSYFLWNGPPDARTLELAAAGRLRERLGEEVERMVADSRFARFLSEFGAQWLALEKFDVLEPDRERFPSLTREARANLRREPIEYLGRLFRENLSARHLVASDFTVANEVVAAYYGFGERVESGFDFVPVTLDGPRLGGLLTQPAILAGLSNGRESNPVKRGAWVARRIVAEPPDPPPPNVPAIDEETPGLTLRQRIEKHRDQPGCRQCHMKIDPWGIPFEEFDAGGRAKAEPVDAGSTLPDGSAVAGVADLQRYLAEKRLDQVAFSVLKHLAIYANGRDLTYYETGRLRQDSRRLAADGYRMRDLIRHVVESEMFLEK